jgi:hypothetical protein
MLPIVKNAPEHPRVPERPKMPTESVSVHTRRGVSFLKYRCADHWLALDEGKQIWIDHVQVGRAHAVRQSRIHLQSPFLDEFRRKER